MKKSNIVIIIFLSCLTVYLLFKLLFRDEYNKLDYILLIILITLGFINSLIIYLRRKKKIEENN